MYLKKIAIKNFRLLKDVSLLLEKQTTVIVGRNNSGKTSLTTLFRRLSSDSSPSFQIEDFSLSTLEDFWKAWMLERDGSEEADIRKVLPIIEVKLTIAYDLDPDLGLLSDFIIDLDPQCSEALVIVRYQLKDGEMNSFFKDNGINPAAVESEQKEQFCRCMKERIPKHYTTRIMAVDPNDDTNQKPLELAKLRALLNCGFINAQRGLDDVDKDRRVLGGILEALFKTATSESANQDDRDIAEKLEDAVQGIQDGIDGIFNEQLNELFPAFKLFGYPGLSDPQLRTETTLDVERLLINHTKVQYAGVNGINLPESYNGLGVRNLIFILLKLVESFKSFETLQSAPGIHLVFIEEPEVHLHPQMQEVFISSLNGIAQIFADKYELPWPVQFVVTTHSSHLANKAAFDSMRYFMAAPEDQARNICCTIIRDLREGLGGTPAQDREFLHKYMTLTRCDLLFADKAILIEGTTERLLLPIMIGKVDSGRSIELQLSSQYVSTVEIGGAYAHIFFRLLNFLQLRTLIITDLDAVNDSGKACTVSKGTHTSNGCIKEWFGPEIAYADLLKKTDEEKTNGIRRITYQVAEIDNGPCGRSFEDAFILANPNLFELGDGSNQVKEDEANKIVQDIVKKKSDFALKYAIHEIEWNVPRYIASGLSWLAGGDRCQMIISSTAAVIPSDTAEIPQ